MGDLSVWDDLAIVECLGHLNALSLRAFGCCSRWTYALSNTEELWMNLILQEGYSKFTFHSSWKGTYLKKEINWMDSVVLKDVVSDFLHNKWYFSVVDMNLWAEDIRKEYEQRKGDLNHDAFFKFIDRRDSSLTTEQFIEEYETPGIPVIFTDSMKDWPANSGWTKEKLVKKYGDSTFTLDQQVYDPKTNSSQHARMTMGGYFNYIDVLSGTEETPIYLFDPAFGEEDPELLQDYQIPKYFPQDLMEVIGPVSRTQSNGELIRPDFRWLLIGPPRSGSDFHIDPNTTSAWNALVSGRKIWVFYPPDITPVGVERRGLSSTLSTESALEWFVKYFNILKEGKMESIYEHNHEDQDQDEDNENEVNLEGGDEAGNEGEGSDNQEGEDEDEDDQIEAEFDEMLKNTKPYMCIQEPGEIVFVPSGWWHMVLNIDLTIAVTHNYVSERNLFKAYQFLALDKEHHFLFKPFFENLRKKEPQMVNKVEQLFKQCQFATIGKQFRFAPYYRCITCEERTVTEDDEQKESPSLACCVGCAQTCHQGHHLTDLQWGRFYCDCNAGTMLPTPQTCLHL
uniref:JmjC domain-containing protein n=1 Tax=Arcella intermedia TaxID=1963864 RepID=A0A6B2L0W0_9EUKA